MHITPIISTKICKTNCLVLISHWMFLPQNSFKVVTPTNRTNSISRSKLINRGSQTGIHGEFSGVREKLHFSDTVIKNINSLYVRLVFKLRRATEDASKSCMQLATHGLPTLELDQRCNPSRREAPSALLQNALAHSSLFHLYTTKLRLFMLKIPNARIAHKLLLLSSNGV